MQIVIYVDCTSVQSHGEFYTGVAANGTRVFWTRQTVIALLAQDGRSNLFYAELLPGEQQALESLDWFGGLEAAAGRKHFIWSDMVNAERELDVLGAVLGERPAAPAPPASTPEMARGVGSNGHPDLSHVTLVDEARATRAQVVRP